MAVELLFADNALAKASVVSLFLLGAFLGCSASSTVADSAGRKKGFQICSVPILIGSILCAMASSLSLVVTGRFLLGFGLGMAIPIMALYIPEISPPQQRGTFGAIPQVLTCSGILAALLAAALLPASSWRMCFWIAAAPAALFCMACELLVDSPRWLAQVRYGAREDPGMEAWQGETHHGQSPFHPCTPLSSMAVTSSHLFLSSPPLSPNPLPCRFPQHGKWAETAAAVTQLLGEAKVKPTMGDLLHSFGTGSHPPSSPSIPPPPQYPTFPTPLPPPSAWQVVRSSSSNNPATGRGEDERNPGRSASLIWPVNPLFPMDDPLSPFLSSPPLPTLQHGKWAEAEAAVTQLLGEAKVKETMDDLHHSFGGGGSRGHGAGWESGAKGESKEGKGEQQGRVYAVLGEGEKGKGVAVAGKGEEEGLVKEWGPVVTIGATLFALQQLSGINAVFFFSSHLFKSAGIQSGAMASVAMGTLNLVASLVCSALIDRVGRKALITGSFIGMGLCMAVQAAAQVLPWMAPMAPLVTLTATLVYVACFTMGAGPVPGLMLPEMLPNHIRAKGMAFAMCVHWVFNFMVGFSFLPLMARFGQTTLFSFFACVCFAGALFTATSLVETVGRSLEEIEEQLLPPA
ncbi:unnamed protein product [Closterium sp. Naga37s-1]|nr:unnamed protein product [Closterium sp. Naga37s-1]